MNYFLHLAILIGIYLPLAYSLNLTLGFGGLLILCHAAFYGIGAYSFALLITAAGLSPVFALIGAVLISSVLAVLIGSISLRFRNDLFMFVTIAFQMITFAVLYNWVDLTNGPYGIAGIPRPNIMGLEFRSPLQYLILITAIDGILIWILFALYASPFGMALKALRDNESAGESLGLQPRKLYLQAIVISATIAAIPGIFFASYLTYIDPTAFTLNESIFLFAILLLGGSGNRLGPLVGVVVMLLLPEILRFIGIPTSVAHNLREIIYGLVLIVLMYARPQGIAGDFRIS